jgi:ferredoxin-type protein NapG
MGIRDRLNSFWTRRSFIKLVGQGIAVLALGGLVRLLGLHNDIIRPPGALPEPEFLSTCIRCDKCRLACPYGYISPVALDESLIGFGSPKLQAETNGHCPRCWRCIYSCPTGALVRTR